MNLKALETDIHKNGSVEYEETGIRISFLAPKKIRNYKIYYRVSYPAKLVGKRKLKQFSSVSDAIKDIDDFLKNREFQTATASEENEIAGQLPRLRKLGVSLTEVIDFYEKRFIAKEKHMTLQEVYDSLRDVLENKGKKLRPRAMESIESQANRVIGDFQNCYMDEISAENAYQWIRTAKSKKTEKPLSGKSKTHYWSMLERLCVRAKGLGALKENPLEEILSEDLAAALEYETPEPKILKVKQVEQLLKEAVKRKSELLPCIILAIYAGLRQSEAFQLSWEHIDFNRKELEVPKEIAKSRNIRFVHLCDAAIAWLGLCQQRSGRLYSGKVTSGSKAFMRLTRFAGWDAKSDATTWDRNACRHTFASHLYAIKGEGYTREQLGHSSRNTEQLYKNYRSAVTEERAREFFAIYPEVG